MHQFRADGFHFRKQVAIGTYVVDFACLHAGLVIEVDGDTHNGVRAQANDRTRDEYLSRRGFTVLRFTNDDVRSNSDGVLTVIAEALKERQRNHRGSPTPLPSSPARGEVPIESVVRSLPNPPADTLPLAGTDGEGGEARSGFPEGNPR